MQYTRQEIDFLLSVSWMCRKDILVLFNERFNKSKGYEAIKRFYVLRGLKRDLKRSPRGVTPTSFKKGSKPHNTRQVGDERICSKDGFVYIKVSEEKGFVAKHHLNWGEPIPIGYNITFKDGDKLNCDKSNLMLVKKSEMLVFNRLYCKKANSKNRESLLLLSQIKNELYSKAP